MGRAIFAVLLVGAVVWVALAFVRSMRMPVTFKSLDEQRLIYSVALWAAKELNKKPGDGQLRYSLNLWAYSVNYCWMGSIPVDELRILSPFIDLMINGKGPPQNLPNEYKDERPDMLTRFKDRMKAEWLWPREAMSIP